MRAIPLYMWSVVVLCLAGTGCNSVSEDVAEPDWPETITFKWLDGPRLHTLQQQVYREPNEELLAEVNAPANLLKTYTGLHDPISNHGLSVRVVYSEKKNVFWLYTPCASKHHVHGYVGPFKGDARVVLDPEPDDLSKRLAPPDPFVGFFTAFGPAQPSRGYLIEHQQHTNTIAIIQSGEFYEISLEPGLKLQTTNRFSLYPLPGERGTIVRWIVADLPFDGLRLQDWRFSPGFVLLRGVGPATFGGTDPETGKDRIGEWSHQLKQQQVAGASWTQTTGTLTHKGKPIPMAKAGSLIITPIGKFLSVGGPGYRDAGWFHSYKGKALFNDDGSLTPAGRALRVLLKMRNR